MTHRNARRIPAEDVALLAQALGQTARMNLGPLLAQGTFRFFVEPAHATSRLCRPSRPLITSGTPC